MSNHKLVQKTLKITAVGAIAFSVLAQPLSLIANAEETTPTKSERQLLQATGQNELLTNSKLDLVNGYPANGQFFNGWTTTSLASSTSDLTSPNSVGSQFSMHSMAASTGYWINDSRYPDVLGVFNNVYSDGSKMLYMSVFSKVSSIDRGAIVVYQDVATVVGKEYTLSQSGTYTANDYVTYSQAPSSPVQSINVFASNSNSKERLALVKATDANQSTTFVAQSTSTRIYAVIGTPADRNTALAVKWQSIDASGNNFFGVSLHVTGIQPDDITNKSEQITGRVGAGEIAPGSTIQATITNKDGDEATYAGTIDSTGHFAIDIDTPKAGEKVVISSGEYSVEKTVLDVIAPDAPTVNTIKNSATQVTGKGVANANVEVLLPDGTVVKGKTDETGAFDITIPKQAVDSEVKVRLINAAGNISAYTTSTVVQDMLANPVVASITPDTTRITGTGVAGATITAKIGNVTYSSTVTPEGTFSINIINKRVAGTEVTIQQSLADAKSNPVVVKVTGGEISDAKAATDALFVNNDSTKGIKPTTDQVAIDAAQEKINKVTDATAKEELQAELNKAQTELNARNAETEATASIKDLFIDNNPANHIKDTTTQAAIDAAQAKLDKVTDVEKKAEMQAQIDKAQAELDKRTSDQKIAEATTSVDNLFIDNNPANHIKDTTTQAAIDAAQAKVNQVTDANKKAELQAQVDKAQKEFNEAHAVIAKPTVNAVTNNDTTVKGTGTPGLTILVNNGTSTFTGVVAPNGTFSVTIPLQKADTILTVTQKNTVKSSDSVSVKVGNYIPAEKVTINPVGPFQQAVTGTAPVGTKMVRLLVNGVAQRTVAPEADGSFSIYSRFVTDGSVSNLRLKAGDTITVDYGNKTPANLATTIKVSAELVKPIVNDVAANADYITGMVPVGTQTLRLVVNGKAQRTITPQANIDAVTAGGIGADGKFKIYSRFITDETGVSRKLKAGDRVTIDSGVQIPGDTGTTVIVK
ncbi:hypothetical protein HB847_13625 [Listeria booriae]|uniref:Bacterial Ig domain-containing protein n=1 Tax=Listeria booriae TaxID=1552123 RepID=A0A841Y928_9LIST|nr:Ig-like domain-containing protein [Listeria booriae]MBC1373414.1 hypothetical protein [Listeria booriae]